MRLRGWFIILTLLISIILIMLIVQTFVPDKFLFYMIEGIVTITIIYLFFFYKQVINPLRAIGNGMEMLNKQEFTSRLLKIHQNDADRIVTIFNRMRTQLKD